MIVNRSSIPSLNDVVTVKLVSGEEIVGKLVDHKIDGITLSNPIQISIQPIGPKQVALAFGPVLGSVSNVPAINIPTSAMAIKPVKTGEDVAKNYREATSSIATPTPQERFIIAP